MEIQALSKDIYDKAKAAGIETITLSFQGGSDEGALYVNISGDTPMSFEPSAAGVTEEEVEEWAWEHYDYSGAGDGNSYGDNIEYDIKNGKASHTSWYHVEHYDDPAEQALVVGE